MHELSNENQSSQLTIQFYFSFSIWFVVKCLFKARSSEKASLQYEHSYLFWFLLWTNLCFWKLLFWTKVLEHTSHSKSSSCWRCWILMCASKSFLVLNREPPVLNFLSFPPSCSLTRTTHIIKIPWNIQLFLQKGAAGTRTSDLPHARLTLYHYTSMPWQLKLLKCILFIHQSKNCKISLILTSIIANVLLKSMHII